MSKIIHGSPTQEEVGLFVSVNVDRCQSSLVNTLLEKEILSWEDITNLYEEVESDTGDTERAKEILEWWLVSDWLLEKLEACGECVLHSDLGDWWGRTCSGQAILLDSVIEDIYMKVMKA